MNRIPRMTASNLTFLTFAYLAVFFRHQTRNMKSIVLFIALFFPLATISYGQSATLKKTTAAGSFAEIKFENQNADLGTIRGDSTAFYNFKFSNTGNRPLLITEVKGSCYCVQGKWPKQSIAPGKSSVINISFGPQGVKGRFIRTLTVRSNGKQPAVELMLSGDIKLGTETKGPHD